ncbi:hypothetical protein APS47_09880 [Leptospira kirschneri serovar Mozdok]|nr:hypothetical protein APS47_09880 [Leptospira kirschneri serovar Mozdok]
MIVFYIRVIEKLIFLLKRIGKILCKHEFFQELYCKKIFINEILNLKPVHPCRKVDKNNTLNFIKCGNSYKSNNKKKEFPKDVNYTV